VEVRIRSDLLDIKYEIDDRMKKIEFRVADLPEQTDKIYKRLSLMKDELRAS